MVVKCSKCGRLLAEKVGVRYISRKRGRTFIGFSGTTIVCEECGECNTLGLHDFEIHDFAEKYPITADSLREICQIVCEFVTYTQQSPEQIERYFFEDKNRTKPILKGANHAEQR